MWKSKIWCTASAVLLVAAVVIGGLVSSVEADPEVARFLLDEGKKALSHRDYLKAIQRFGRAREEDPELLEASYLLGTAYEKAREPGSALAAYRAFRDGCAELQKSSELDRKHKGWLRKAEGRIKTLGKGEAELDKLTASFSKRVLAFARKHREDDPDIAAHALRQLLSVELENEEARELLEEIAGRDELALPAQAQGDVPIAGITEWDDILARKGIDEGGVASYRKGLLVLDQRHGCVKWLDRRTQGAPVHVYEMEFRVLEEHAAGWSVGLTLGLKSGEATKSGEEEFVLVFVGKTLAHLVKTTGRRNQDVADAVLDPIRLGSWVRLTAAVEGRKVRMFMDGKLVLQSTIPAVRDLAGGVGIFHQRCHCEIRLLRLGRKP